MPQRALLVPHASSNAETRISSSPGSRRSIGPASSSSDTSSGTSSGASTSSGTGTGTGSSSSDSSDSSSSRGNKPRPPRWLSWLRLPAIPWKLDGAALLRQLRLLGLGLLAAAMLLVARYTSLVSAHRAPREVLYSDFVGLLDRGAVRAARLESATSKLYFECTPADSSSSSPQAAAPASSKKQAASSAAASSVPAAAAAAAPVTATPAAAKPLINKRFFIKLADKQDPLLVSKILAAGVEYSVIRPSFQAQLQQMLMTLLALWIPLLPLLFVVQRMMNDRNGRRKKVGGLATPRVTFADVAGVSAAKEELREVVACLRNAEAYTRVRARMPGGVVLYGPPGTGKTLLAKAVAGEAGVPFIAVSASEFVELFVGRGAARVRELFAEARRAAPCVVFIDELDALGGRRGVGFNDERDQTLNQLLTELDGFEGRPGVMLLGATNRVDVLDPALLRPGRISRRVLVPLPDEAGRAAILGVHLRGVELAGGDEGRTAVARQLAALTPGFSGAELANVVNEALLLVARRGGEGVEPRDLLSGISRTRYGINGGSGGSLGEPPAALRRLGRWLLETAGQGGQQVKVASSG